MDKNKLCILLLTIAFLPLQVLAQQEKQVFHFLGMPSSAQALAAGGKSITIVDDEPGLAFENPALLGDESGGRLFLSYMNYMGGVNLGNVCYASELNERAMWGIGARYLSYGSMMGYNEQGQATSDFSANDIALQGFFSYALSDYFRGGVSLKGLYSGIERYSSWGLGVDVGISYYNDDKGYSAAAVFKNVGAQLNGFNDEREPLAWDFQLGFSRSFIHAPFRLHLIVHNLNPAIFRAKPIQQLSKGQKLLRHFIVGLEFTPSENLWISLGYNPQMAQAMELAGGNKWGGFTAGAGVGIKSFRIGVAAARYHPAGLSFMMNVSTSLRRSSIF